MAKNKSTSNTWLFKHAKMYSFILTIFITPFITFKDFDADVKICMSFYIIILTLHFITDWITSRAVSKRFKAQNYHDGFVIIGFDQILHYLQLLIVLWVLIKN